MLTRFVLRRPGFPLDLLDRLRCTGLTEGRVVLRELFGDPRITEALWLSNPTMADVSWPSYTRHWRPDGRGWKIRRLERRLYSYLQRFCAKNDTTSFFGPLDYGEFGGDTADLTTSEEKVRRRRAFFAYRAASELAGTAGAHLGAVLTIPPSTLDPLAHLAGELRGLPEDETRTRWLSEVTELDDARAGFAGATLTERRVILAGVEERFARLVADAPVRTSGQGRMFTDRSLLYEECLGDVARLRLTTRDHDRITEAFAPVARLCAEHGRRVALDLADAGTALLAELGDAVPFPRFAAAWRKRFGNGPPTPRADRLAADLSALVLPDEPVCRLSPSEVDALCTTPGDPVVMSPDLMLDAADFAAIASGDYRVVVGEVHHGVQPVGWMLCHADEPEAWLTEITAHLPHASGVQPANLVFGRRMKVAPPEFPGPSVEVGGVSSGTTRLRLADLIVRKGAHGPELVAGGAPLRFYPPSFGVPASFSVFACFTFPLAVAPRIATGTRTPRVEIGDVVYQRRRWRFDTAALPSTRDTDSPALLAGFAGFRAAHGLPERVFVRAPGEPKPVYVDFESQFSVELLAAVAGTADRITVEEMLPGPDGCWLRREDGRYPSELRTVCSVAGW